MVSQSSGYIVFIGQLRQNVVGSLTVKLWCHCAREQCSGAFRSVVCNLSIGRFIFSQLKLSVFCSVNLFLPVLLDLFILGGLECKMVKKLQDMKHSA